MSEANARTLETYNDGVEKYIDGTVQVVDSFQKDWLDFVFRDVPKSAKILEIGSAFGRDAAYLQDKGYDVALTDASRGFVDHLNASGMKATQLDIITQKPQSSYNVILACAVFLHFTDEDFRKAVSNVRESLEPGGMFAFSLKQGDGEGWSEEKMGAPRYFHYWRRDGLEKVLDEVGMQITDFQILSDGKWLHIISTPKESR